MAAILGRGGQNRVSIEEHRRRGTLRPARHVAAKPLKPAAAKAGDDERAAALRGLSPSARVLGRKVLGQFTGWDAAGLRTLRSYVLSCERLQKLERDGETTPALEREVKVSLQLLRALNLEVLR